MCQGKERLLRTVVRTETYLTLVNSDRKGSYSVDDMNLEMTALVGISHIVARRFSYLFKGHFLNPLSSS